MSKALTFFEGVDEGGAEKMSSTTVAAIGSTGVVDNEKVEDVDGVEGCRRLAARRMREQGACVEDGSGS